MVNNISNRIPHFGWTLGNNVAKTFLRISGWILVPFLYGIGIGNLGSNFRSNYDPTGKH